MALMWHCFHCDYWFKNRFRKENGEMVCPICKGSKLLKHEERHLPI